MNKKILVTSEKDNIGKSLFSVKLAISIAENEKKVVIVEYTNKNKSIADYLGFEEEIIYDLKDALEKVCTLEQSLKQISERVDLLPAPRLKNKKIETDSLKFADLLNTLSKTYDYIIVETSSISACVSIDLKLINSILIMNNNDFSSIREINNDFLISNEYKIINKYIIINKFDKSGAKTSKKLKVKDYTKVFPQPLLTIVPYKHKYDNFKTAYLLNERKDKLSNCIKELAQKVL
ncbi:AAA family ATPase [Sedimentibacter sp. zth1]|uniref:nucleotide-binding protein n=1 Tax=Sedimentibacter sp. zth1 TaxID=2816908 RepID=UPI001A926CAD|nr:AAA family ATPase [Sedimentibacter sp. zth1]QSX06212.1 AAA family ATPase [Sedimentibacter sp. zth1]